MLYVDCVWNVMAHAQKPHLVFRAKQTSPFKSAGGCQFSQLLAAEVCASAVVMLGTPCSEVVRRVLATHSIRQFLLHFPSHVSLCAITLQMDSTCSNPEYIDTKLQMRIQVIWNVMCCQAKGSDILKMQCHNLQLTRVLDSTFLADVRSHPPHTPSHPWRYESLTTPL